MLGRELACTSEYTCLTGYIKLTPCYDCHVRTADHFHLGNKHLQAKNLSVTLQLLGP